MLLSSMHYPGLIGIVGRVRQSYAADSRVNGRITISVSTLDEIMPPIIGTAILA